jgi:hypothetical protein
MWKYFLLLICLGNDILEIIYQNAGSRVKWYIWDAVYSGTFGIDQEFIEIVELHLYAYLRQVSR